MNGSERPQRGDLVAGKYLIDEVLGEGGMGVVFGAVHQITQRRLALKWMFPWLGRQPSGKARFLREARAAGQIEHPNVIEVLDVVEQGDSVFVVMEYLSGETYRSVIERGDLTPHRAIEILIPAMRGVAVANARGVIHRDLKPDNIFLCRNPDDGKPGPVKVLDFGVSKLIDVGQHPTQNITEDGKVLGTPAYMSPEQVRGDRDLDARVDVYAFGVILYESFSGKLPFDAETSNTLLIQVTTQEVLPLRRLCPDLPEALEQIVARAMARDRSNRFASVSDLVDALMPFTRNETVESSRTRRLNSSSYPLPDAEAVFETGVRRAIEKTRPDSSELPSKVRSRQAVSSSESGRDSSEERFPHGLGQKGEPFPLQLGRFQLLNELGRGGTGVVYLAFDPKRNAQVALKSLSRREPTSIYRLKNEFRVLSELVHPNLVGLHELFADQGHWYFTMDFVHGEHFINYVRPKRSGRRRLDEIRLRSSLRQIVSAVTAIHAAGKLHRDLKPSNVLVTPNSRVVVLDFGLATDQSANGGGPTLDTAIVGTPAYMSPEQASGAPADEASDWYAFGVMLYEALTGQLPFGGSALHIISLKQRAEAPDPRAIVYGLSPNLCELCSGLLLRDKNERLTGADVLQYLESDDTGVIPLVSRTPTSQPSVFIGRDSEMFVLRAAFDATLHGKSAAVFVGGLSGVGKSALIERFTRQLGEQAIVLTGRCYERESVPYKAFDSLVDALARQLRHLSAAEVDLLLPRDIALLSRVFPVLRRVEGIDQAGGATIPATQQELRRRAFLALKELLRRLALRTPLLLFLDDLQWGDLDSARLLGEVLGPPDSPLSLFVGCYRTEEESRSAFLREMLNPDFFGTDEVAIHRLRLEPLPSTDATLMAEHLLGDQGREAAKVAEGIARESAGVPFFIGALVQHYKETPKVETSVSLEEVLSTRICNLPTDCGRLLEITSVSGRSIDEVSAYIAADIDTANREAARILQTANLIRVVSGGQIQTYHDRIREHVVARLSQPRLTECHARLAHVYETSEKAEVEWLVEHFRGAGERKKAAEYAIKAADNAAEKLAFNRSASLYEVALELIEQGDPRRRALFRKQADALANAALSTQAVAAYRCAMEGATGQELRELKRLTATQLIRGGDIDQGTVLANDLLREYGLSYPKGTTACIAALLWHKARLAVRGYAYRERSEAEVALPFKEKIDALAVFCQELYFQDPLRAAVLQTQYLRFALDSGEPIRILKGLVWDILNRAFQGGARNRQKISRATKIIENIAARQHSPYALATFKMGQAAFFIYPGGYIKDALKPLAEAERLFRDQCVGASWEYNFAAYIRYILLEITGNISQIVQEVPEKIRKAAETDDQAAIASLLFTMPLIFLLRDEPKAAMAFLDEQRQRWTGLGEFDFDITLRTVDTLLYQGEGLKAFEFFTGCWKRLIQYSLYRVDVLKLSYHFYRAKCALAAYLEKPDPRLLKLAKRDAEILNSLRIKFPGHGSCINGILAYHAGDKEQARTYLKRAIAEFESDHVDSQATSVRYVLGQIEEGENGRQLIAQSEFALVKNGVRNPKRMVTLWAPIVKT